MALEKTRRSRFGLLTRGRDFEKEVASADTRQKPPGEIITPKPLPDPTDFSGVEVKKLWQEPCFFSCVPDKFTPVDVYTVAGTLVPKSTATWTNLETLEVPSGKIFRLDRAGVAYQVGGAADISYRLTVNGNPVGIGFGKMNYAFGALNYKDMLPIGLNIQGPATVKIDAINSSVASDWTAWGRMFGWLGPDV